MNNIDLIKNIMEVINKNTSVFVFNNLGIDYLSEYQKYILKKNGIDLEILDKMPKIERAFYFGIYAQTLKKDASFKATKKEFQTWLNKEIQKPISIKKKIALDFVKNRSYVDIVGLGNKIGGNLSNKIIAVSNYKQNKSRDEIKTKTIKAIENNLTPQQLAGILRETLGDWARDFSRIADYIMQEAYANGRCEEIFETYGDDVEVYKQTFPGVCKPCSINYGEPYAEPIKYKLKDIVKNGTNIGRKEQIPVVGPAHPWSRSILHAIPKDGIWSSQKQQYIIQRNTQGINRKSKVKITITP
jgi:hypothetical protein